MRLLVAKIKEYMLAVNAIVEDCPLLSDKPSEDSTVGGLTRKVNSLINHGWQPLGGVSYCPERNALCQAMVKFGECFHVIDKLKVANSGTDESFPIEIYVCRLCNERVSKNE